MGINKNKKCKENLKWSEREREGVGGRAVQGKDLERWGGVGRGNERFYFESFGS